MEVNLKEDERIVFLSKKCYWECECVVLAYFSAVVYIIYKD